MGKAIIIKNADFSAQGVGRVSFINHKWICEIGDKMKTIIDDLTSEPVLTASNLYFFGPSSSLVFSGKTITKIAARFTQNTSDYTLTYGVCNKNTNTAQSFHESYEQVGSVTIPYNANGSVVNITPFVVPEGKTVVFTLGAGVESGKGFIGLYPSVMQSGTQYGVPGLDRVNSGRTTYTADATMTIFIDFLVDVVEAQN